MKQSFHFFGFNIDTRKFILTLVMALTVILFLIGVDILWFDISWYGLMIGTGFVLAVVIASELAKERGLYKDFSYDVIWYIFPLAIIGARAFYVLSSLGEFATIADAFKIWEGGLSIFGGIMGGTLGVVLFGAIKKVNIAKMFDVIVPVLIMAQGIGRWGNFFNQEVYGLEITASWLQWFPVGVFIDNGLDTGWFLALFFYESVLNLVGFFVLTTVLRKTKKTGIPTFSYLLYYGTVRVVLESLRAEQYVLSVGQGLQTSSLMSIVFIIIGLSGLLYFWIKHMKYNKQ